MIYRFAKGDTYALIFRPKVLMIFVRYIFATIVILGLAIKSLEMSLVFFWVGLIGYALWAIQKNYQFAKNGWYYLPLLQIGSDVTIMMGSLVGLIQRVNKTCYPTM